MRSSRGRGTLGIVTDRPTHDARLFELTEVYVKALGDESVTVRYAVMKFGIKRRTAFAYLKAVKKTVGHDLKKHVHESARFLFRRRFTQLAGKAEALSAKAEAQENWSSANAALGTAISAITKAAEVEGVLGREASLEGDSTDRLAPVGAWVPNEQRTLDAETVTEGEA